MNEWNFKYTTFSMGDIPTWLLGTDKTLMFKGFMFKGHQTSSPEC